MPKIKKIVLILSALLSLGFFGPIQVLAAGNGLNPDCSKVTNDPQISAPKVSCTDCQKDGASSICNCYPQYSFGSQLTQAEQTSCETCNNAGLKYDVTTDAGKSQLTQDCLQNNPIKTDINIFVNVLSALATLVIIGTLIAGGIQYSMAGNPQAATNARKRIINGLLALAGLFFLWAFLQWLIPGGV